MSARRSRSAGTLARTTARRPPFEVVQDDHLEPLVRKLAERPPQQVAPRDPLAVAGRSALDDLPHHIALLAPPPTRDPPRDPEQPRSHPARRIEIAPPLMYDDEHVVHRIGDIAPRHPEPPDRLPHVSEVLVVHGIERLHRWRVGFAHTDVLPARPQIRHGIIARPRS